MSTAMDTALSSFSSAATDSAWQQSMNDAWNSPGMSSAGGGIMAMIMGAGIVILVIFAIIALIMLISWWKIFTKAGQPGWAILVPIYNYIVMLKVAGKPWWWFFLLCIPIVNIVILIMMFHGISTGFGKGAGFTAGLIFLGIIFVPILGFGIAKYVGHPAKA